MNFVEIINLNVNFKNIILVNFDNELLIRNLHGALRFNFINRNFFAPKLGVSNEAYLIASRNYSDLIEGIHDVRRDYFWNPRGEFFILITEQVEFDPEMFKKLHDMYVFQIYLIFTSRYTQCTIYSYDFNKSAHCSFSSSAINGDSCDNFISKAIKKRRYEMKKRINEKLKRKEIPYSGCKNITFMVVPTIPNAFPQLNGKNKKEIGYEEVFYTIMQEMGYFNFNFVFADEDDIVGFLSENHTVTGLMERVEDGAIDGIFGGIIASGNRIGIFDIVYPHLYDELLMLVHQTTILEKWKAMFFTFTPLVRTLVLFSSLVFSVIAYKINIFGQTRVKNKTLLIITLYGYFVGTTHKNIQNKFLARFLLISWAMFTWLIVCFFQSHLASVFTKPAFHHQVQSLEEMYQQNFSLYMTKGTYIYLNTTKSVDFGDLINRIVICDSMDDSFEAISSSERAGTIASVILYNYHKESYLDMSLRPKIYAIRPPLSFIYVTAYMKKGHPDLEKLRFLERHVLTGYFHRKRLSELIHQNTLSHISSNTSQYAGALDLKNVQGLYYFLLVGYVISIIVFLCEVGQIKTQSNSKVSTTLGEI